MKKVFLNRMIPTLLGVFAVVIVGTGCPTPTPIAEDDNISPNIFILSPFENATFITDNTAVIEATATDEFKIVIGSATVYNEANVEVDYYEETSVTQNNASINRIYTSFSTSNPGNYTIEYMFEDVNGNVRTLERHITFEPQETDGDTDS